jgi:hypothetical protein
LRWSGCAPARIQDEWLEQRQPGSRVQVIKIDAEGAEENALLACRRIIARDRPIIYCEISERALERFGSSVGRVQAFLRSFGYEFFRNTGARNSSNDEFVLASLDSLADGGGFFDVLAIHPDSPRHPKRTTDAPPRFIRRALDSLKALLT